MGRKTKLAIRTGGSGDWGFNKLMKKFKRQSEERGSPDLYYTSPSEERRNAHAKAVNREEKRVEKDSLRPLPHQRHG